MSIESLLLAGSFGFGNIGDEAVPFAIRDLLESMRRSAAIACLSRFDSPEKQAHGTVIGLSNAHSEEREACSGAPIALVGGGVFEPRWNAVAFRCKAEMLRRRRPSHVLACNAEAGAYGIRKRISTKRLWSKCQTFSARDIWSARVLQSITGNPVACVGDIVLSMRPPKTQETAPHSSRPPIVVSLAPAWREAEWVQWIARELVALARQLETSIVFLPMAARHDGDIEIAGTVADEMKRSWRFEDCVQIREQLDPRTAMETIAKAKLVVGMRLHACVMASAANVPVVGLAYHPKVMAFADTIGIANQVAPQLAFEASYQRERWRYSEDMFPPGLLRELAERALSKTVDLSDFRARQAQQLAQILDA